MTMMPPTRQYFISPKRQADSGCLAHRSSIALGLFGVTADRGSDGRLTRCIEIVTARDNFSPDLAAA
jgi:hypothetical protein